MQRTDIRTTQEKPTLGYVKRNNMYREVVLRGLLRFIKQKKKPFLFTIVMMILLFCILRYTNFQSPQPLNHIEYIDNFDKPVNKDQAHILRWVNKKWKRLSNYCGGNYKFLKATLKGPSGETPIFVHELTDDASVSGTLFRNGMWDPDNVNLVHKYLLENPEMALIDLGAHVGTFSLMAAKLGRQVLSVDPLRENILRLCKSIEAGGLTDKITVFFTALSNTYSQFTFQRDHANIGGTRLSDKKVSIAINESVIDSGVINTVHLDDLLPLVNFKRAFLKIDVEEHELQVLEAGIHFLDTVDVPYILMEWFWHKKLLGQFGQGIIEFMTVRDYKPYTPLISEETLLRLEDYRHWPIDVLWKKTS
ncbi:uncharacterized protein LOC126825275 [Patella vulgata]|uniref:uncharacterized protein LOC126825275 n=1 Tax=Patella vulgata TaxID=6465 RepID=UPI0021805BB0|nr:uncharacterized protein LOC126825275 [Patella vulgata]